jgi:high-affinity iron transporter
MVIGGCIGLILGSSVCLLTYLGLITIPMRYLFGVTSALIALLAAGMAAQAIAFLEQADILTALDETVWDTSWILSDSSYLGRALHTLIGYVDQPTAMQLIFYAATLGAMIVLMKLFSAPSARRRQTAKRAAHAVAEPAAE